MGGVEAVYVFTPIAATDAPHAYAFHARSSAVGELVWLRTAGEIESFAKEGSLFGVWLADQLVALSYAAILEEVWEIGGLSVDAGVRHRGIGAVLLRFVLAYTIVSENRLFETPMLTHVHQLNDAPRGLLLDLGFERSGTVAIDPAKAPPNLPRDASGLVIGDTFRFSERGLVQLCGWFESFDGRLQDGALCRFRVGKPLIRDLKQALRDIAACVSRLRN
jgi:GNAT superfamily N-acetyltransferase